MFVVCLLIVKDLFIKEREYKQGERETYRLPTEWGDTRYVT